MASAFSQLMEQLEDFKIRVDEQRRRQQRLSIIKSSVSLMIYFLAILLVDTFRPFVFGDLVPLIKMV